MGLFGSKSTTISHTDDTQDLQYQMPQYKACILVLSEIQQVVNSTPVEQGPTTAKEFHEIYTGAINFWGVRPNFIMTSQSNRPKRVKSAT